MSYITLLHSIKYTYMVLISMYIYCIYTYRVINNSYLNLSRYIYNLYFISYYLHDIQIITIKFVQEI